MVEGAMAKLGIQFDGHVRSLGIDQNGAGKQATLVRAGRLRKVRGWARKMQRLRKAGAAVHTVANVGLQRVFIHGAKVLVVRPRHRWAPYHTTPTLALMRVGTQPLRTKAGSFVD